MNCCALLFLLLICGSGNCNRQNGSNCGCNNIRQRDRDDDCGCQNARNAESHCDCRANERDSQCSCNDNNAGIIPPPWVRVDGDRDNNQSCGCNNRH